MLLTAEVNPPGHGVRHPPAEAYLKRLGRPNLFLLAAPSLDGDWWLPVGRAANGAPRGTTAHASQRVQPTRRAPRASLQRKAPRGPVHHPSGVPSSNLGTFKADNQLRRDDCHAGWKPHCSQVPELPRSYPHYITCSVHGACAQTP